MDIKNDFSDLTVMVLDDDECILMLMETMVRKAGVKNLFVMEHSPEAVRMLKHNKVDMIISDVQMPDCDGFEFCQHLAHMGYEGVLAFSTGGSIFLLTSMFW